MGRAAVAWSASEPPVSERRSPVEQVVVEEGATRDPQIELAPPGLKARLMVRWYDPRNVLRSAKKVFVSTVIGKHVDQRMIEALGSDRPRYFDYRDCAGRDADGGLWIDYVADTGDGWDSTFTVARGVGAARLSVGDASGGDDATELPRASILVFGGDAVYPVGSRQNYDERLVAPYAAAITDLPDDQPHPDLFAIPGNHDWYDSLVAFSRKFISERWFAHWRTQQNRSYFALRLPGGWWLLGTDVQLGSDLDGEQLAYFEYIASCMDEGDRVILCNAEPHWIYEALGSDEDRYRSSNLRDLEARVLRDRTWLYLAGDLHHYRRHASTSDDRQKITAGGGGAFMHPTHTNPRKLETITDEARTYALDRASCFPPTRASWWVVMLNLLPLGVVWRQPWFFVVPGLLYLLTCWMVPLDLVQHHILTEFWRLVDGVWGQLLMGSRGGALWTALVLGGFIVLTPARRLGYRLIGGLAHAFAHMAAVMLCAWAAARWTRGLDPASPSTYLAQGAIVLALGGLIGSTIFGWYLTVMCQVFGVHQNEATAAQRWKHWKSFLRLRVGADGALTIHPIGIARTPRWRSRGYRKGAPPAVPRDGRPDREIYRYIEAPVVIRPRAPSSAS